MFAQLGMATSATCESGAEDQTVDHVAFQCPIHRHSYGLHGLTVLGDETIAAQQLLRDLVPPSSELKELDETMMMNLLVLT